MTKGKTIGKTSAFDVTGFHNQSPLLLVVQRKIFFSGAEVERLVNSCFETRKSVQNVKKPTEV